MTLTYARQNVELLTKLLSIATDLHQEFKVCACLLVVVRCALRCSVVNEQKTGAGKLRAALDSLNGKVCAEIVRVAVCSVSDGQEQRQGRRRGRPEAQGTCVRKLLSLCCACVCCRTWRMKS